MKFCKFQNLNSQFCEISFLELPKYSWNLKMVSMIEKFKNWKNLLKNSWTIGTPFGRWSWKIGMPSWIIGTRLARGYVDYADMHDTYGVWSQWR